MRRILYNLALLTLVYLSATAGTSALHAEPDCPTITVECVDCPAAVMQGEPVTFTVSISGVDSNFQPTFNWTISAGTITTGQGTNSIKVDTTGQAFNPITATVEVGGIRITCPKTASLTTEIVGCILPRKFDEFGDIAFEDEKARLENFGIQLQNESGAVG